MKPEHKIIIREQLEATLNLVSKAAKTSRPQKGWIRAVREALGMSGKQFANRLGVKPPRITALEKDEMTGAVTIKKMQEAANALDCDLFYALIPRETLSEIVRKQADNLAKKRIQRVSHSMLLESQQLSNSEQKKALNAEVEKILRQMPRELWEDHG
jgi:predicted DNA-binding mobile mystery protein A